jgi:hypothetical protein
LQSEVDCGYDFFLAGLEEGEFDVGEGHIDDFPFY